MFRSLVIIGVILAAMLGAAAAGRPSRPAAAHYHKLNLWEKMALGSNLLSIILLALTGFWATLAQRHALTGYLLMIHAGLGGLFFTSLAALAVTFAEACRIEDTDWTGAPQGRFPLAQKLAFWGLLLFGLGVTLTMLVSMLPVTGAAGLDWLYQAHRLCALLVVMVVAGFGVYLRLRPTAKTRVNTAESTAQPPAEKAGIA